MGENAETHAFEQTLKAKAEDTEQTKRPQKVTSAKARRDNAIQGP